MTSIRFVKGDATLPHGTGLKILAHVWNDLGRWGKGFVLAISSRWPDAERAYREWYRGRNDFALGAVQFVEVEQYMWVANMVAQHGVRGSSRKPPIRYEAVEECLGKVAEKA